MRLVKTRDPLQPVEPLPLAMTFEDHVRRALDSLPPELARGLENVAVVVEDENPEEPDLLGLFEEHPYMPAKISIYRLPLEESFPDPRELERRDPHHRPPRARALLRDRRGPPRRARLRLMVTLLNAVAIAAAVVGAGVIVWYFLGR